MAQRVAGNIDNAVKARSQRRARRGGSIEEEIRDNLCSAAVEPISVGGLGKEIAGLFAKIGLRADIPELRGHKIMPFA